MLSVFLVPSLLSALVFGETLLGNFRVHEALENIPTGFIAQGPAAPGALLNLRLALVQNDIRGLVDALYNVSTPSSPSYGQHLSKQEVEAYVTPSAESDTSVNSWLNENGLNASALTPAGDWLAIQVPVSKANQLFNTNFSVFTHVTTGLQTVRTLSYSIPEKLTGHLDLVHPTITFPDPYGNSVRSLVYSSAVNFEVESMSTPCANITFMTPACLQHLYKIPSTPATSASNHLAITGYEGSWANEADLMEFLKKYRPDMNSSTTFTLQTLDGGLNIQNRSLAGVEADLDTQYTIGIATDVRTTFLSVGGNFSTDGFLESLLDTANYLLGETTPPQVVTTSYGLNENLVSPKLAENLCNAYAQLGARGVSMLFASGDGGVSGLHYLPPGEVCTTFLSTFPSTCPYVTSVGGTVDIPETAVNLSSGGFSNYFTRPDYQSGAVSSYLSILGDNDTGLYNASGRGFPDVAAYAVNYSVVIDAAVTPITGTSCATPVFASVIALLNDKLIAAGKPVLGFLNPFLYSKGASALTDIVSGNNRACANDTGFDAAVGWDPITGLGTPNFILLQETVGL